MSPHLFTTTSLPLFTCLLLLANPKIDVSDQPQVFPSGHKKLDERVLHILDGFFFVVDFFFKSRNMKHKIKDPVCYICPEI